MFSRVAKSFMRQRSAATRTQRVLGSVKEQKNIDVRTLNTAIVAAGTTGVGTLLNGVAQGTSGVTRLGRRINMESLLIRFAASMKPTTTGASALRLMIVYDLQPNGAAMTAAQLLTTDEITGVNLLDNSRRFKVICDELIGSMGQSGPASVEFHKWIKLNLPVEFNTGNAGTIADIATGSLWMWVWQDGQIATASPQTLQQTRVRFSDA